tara:strand:+ start:219 stop:890 length:672 start_codon:yes stop_codon:yes gene_type:complete
MRLKKKLLKNIIVQNILGILTAVYILIVRVTSRINIVNQSSPDYFWKNNKPFILAFWHSQLMMISFCWKSKYGINILASGHSDGRFGAIVGKYFKLKNIPTYVDGQNKNIRLIYNLLKNNKYIGITPDGPRGPKEKASSGIIKISKATQVPIIALGFDSTSNKKLGSWDSFLLTYPFSKCCYVWSDPILIPNDIKDNEIQKYQNLIESEINKCIEAAKGKLSV